MKVCYNLYISYSCVKFLNCTNQDKKARASEICLIVVLIQVKTLSHNSATGPGKERVIFESHELNHSANKSNLWAESFWLIWFNSFDSPARCSCLKMNHLLAGGREFSICSDWGCSRELKKDMVFVCLYLILAEWVDKYPQSGILTVQVQYNIDSKQDIF